MSPLSTEQVSQELTKMQAFIRKEAEEKSREIRLKADEEYEIDKSQLVRSETASIDALYETKLKKAGLKQQIAKSTIANKTRLRVLSTRDGVLDDIFNSAEEELKKITKDEKTYLAVLEGLIEEGVLALLEPVVSVKVRPQDVELAQKAVEKAQKHYNEKTKNDVKITVSEEALDKDSAGGVILVNGNGKIEVNNTLSERLTLLREESLPALRVALFGISQTRKFFD